MRRTDTPSGGGIPQTVFVSYHPGITNEILHANWRSQHAWITFDARKVTVKTCCAMSYFVYGHWACYMLSSNKDFLAPLVQIHPRFHPRLDIAAGQRPEIPSHQTIQAQKVCRINQGVLLKGM